MVNLYQNDIIHFSTPSNRNPPVSPILISAVYFHMANNHGIVIKINITKKILNAILLAQLTSTGEGRLKRVGEC